MVGPHEPTDMVLIWHGAKVMKALVFEVRSINRIDGGDMGCQVGTGPYQIM